MISHFAESTDFTLSRIEALSDGKAPDMEGLDVVVVSKQGEDFDVSSSLAKGKVTIIDFYADWCGPCKVLEKKLVEYMKEHPGIALRKVNIVDWESVVARKHLEGVAGIPYLMVFDSSGNELYRGTGDFEKVLQVIDRRDSDENTSKK